MYTYNILGGMPAYFARVEDESCQHATAQLQYFDVVSPYIGSTHKM